MNNLNLSQQELNHLCFIEASGHFLGEHIPHNLCDDNDAIIAFIADNKCEIVEYHDDEAVLELIETQASVLESFVKFITDKYSQTPQEFLSKHLSIDELKTIDRAAKSDIWYDAHDHDDHENARLIEDAQNAMCHIADVLTPVLDGKCESVPLPETTEASKKTAIYPRIMVELMVDESELNQIKTADHFDLEKVIKRGDAKINKACDHYIPSDESLNIDTETDLYIASNIDLK